MRKVALITGASGGIGGAIAEVLSRNFDLALTYNSNRDKCLELKNKLENICRVEMYHVDLSSDESIVKLVENVYSDFGQIDLLVNNAGIAIDKLFCDRETSDFRKTFDVNVVGTFLLSKLVGQQMFDAKFGSIINISSTNGINTYFPMCIDYDASKSAINSMTHNLAMQFAPYVRVNGIAPGFIGTDSELREMDKEYIESEKQKIFVRRVGLPEDVAYLVEFLASDRASFINNEIIRIDGGMYGTV